MTRTLKPDRFPVFLPFLVQRRYNLIKAQVIQPLSAFFGIVSATLIKLLQKTHGINIAQSINQGLKPSLGKFTGSHRSSPLACSALINQVRGLAIGTVRAIDAACRSRRSSVVNKMSTCPCSAQARCNASKPFMPR